MGKRSRKRGGADGPLPTREERTATSATALPRAPSRRARMDEAPPAPWAPFPLTELVILVGLITIAIGVFSGDDTRLRLLVAGFVLILLASIELSLREHFAGFRSHSALIAGALAMVFAVVLGVVGVPPLVVVPVTVVGFGAAFWWMRRVFMARSGGLGFRA